MIRPYKPQDEESVLHIWLEASTIGHAFIPRSYWESKIDNMREIYLPQSETYIYTDTTTGKISGFISLVGDYLAAIFVAPSCQRRGIGQALMAHAKKLKNELVLNVYTENTQAILFYKQQGFKIVDEQTDEATGHKEFKMVFPQ
ncbi:N-acetyltransferase [Odoribacter sp. AF15-53]|uniref:N-acetyltransferase n=1 Tax=Odoribacter sp. AF15-53 TaxID=2292236 RepID=UPI000E53DBAE|nr:N-acetyltransferase [Odoribacter sp. AF15-53]RHR79859.1 N-acetyltransferase [Odoribacter sp. AF15-53]